MATQMALNEPAKANYLEMERRWMDQARSYEITERLPQFDDKFKARYRSKE
jgi:hypothetical protein